MINVTCRLTARNRDQLRNPILSNRVWATFTILHSPLLSCLFFLESSSYFARVAGDADVGDHLEPIFQQLLQPRIAFLPLLLTHCLMLLYFRHLVILVSQQRPAQSIIS